MTRPADLSRILLLIFGLLAASGRSPMPAAAGPPLYDLKIRPRSVIVGPDIHLSEICDIAPASKELKARLDSILLGKAAPPGESKDISLSRIRLQLRRYGIDQQIRSITGPKIIRIHTAHEDLTRLRIQESIAAHVDSLMKATGVEFSLEFKRLPERIAVPIAPFHLQIREKSAAQLRGYQNFDGTVLQQGQVVQRFAVAAIVRTFEKVAVAKRVIAAREHIGPEDVRVEKRETTYQLDSAPLDFSRAGGVRARVRLAAGQIITEKKIELTPAVERGEAVDLHIQAGAVVLQTRALAQEAGQINDWIRVWNKETRRVLRGKIINEKTVYIKL